MKKRLIFSAAVVALTALVASSENLPSAPKPERPAKKAPVAIAGCRCSSYGIRPFPSGGEWISYAEKIRDQFPGSVPSFIWIVGCIGNNGHCYLNFPLGAPLEKASGSSVDKNEEFLALCDEKGCQVWLQVEPGDADIVALATRTMARYKQHPSVKGFGVDVEWYKTGNTNGYGTPLSDEVAEAIDKAVKKVDPRFNCFVKHWNKKWLPKTYRSDMIFVDDSQQHHSFASMKNEFKSWADYFAPNTVVYQIGYKADTKIWDKFDLPVKALGDSFAAGVQENQNCGIIWVDFTLKKLLEKLQ